MNVIIDIFFIGSFYQGPTSNAKMGFCGVLNSASLSDLEHRSCHCIFDKDGDESHAYVKFCEIKCNEDNECKGYSYWDYERSCKFYTTSSICSKFTKKESRRCNLKGATYPGQVGPIHTVVAPGQKGCFIKEWRKY